MWSVAISIFIFNYVDDDDVDDDDDDVDDDGVDDDAGDGDVGDDDADADDDDDVDDDSHDDSGLESYQSYFSYLLLFGLLKPHLKGMVE